MNLLLLHCHDLGRFLGCYGVGTVHTPALDALAADAMRFDSAFCVAPQCSPSRASLFTGRYPQQHGVNGLTHSWFGFDLGDGERHLASVLGERGYATTLLGVHHESRLRPDDQVAARLGFDRVRTGGSAPEVAARATAALRDYAAGDSPFYLQVGFFEPHRAPSAADDPATMGFLSKAVTADDSAGVTVPGYLRDDAAARAEIAELQGAVAAMDSGVGEILAAVDELGLREDTVIVFTTDHGLALPRAKCSLYDPGIEVALIVRAPGRWTGGQTSDALVSNVDVFPTVLELLGISAGVGLSGRSLLSGPPRSEIFAAMTYHDYYDPRRCVRTADHKLIVNFSSAPFFMDPSQSWRPRCTPVDLTGGGRPYHPPVELYDLRADPLELDNLAGDPPEHLMAALAGWMREVDDPLLHGAAGSPMQELARQLVTAAQP